MFLALIVTFIYPETPSHEKKKTKRVKHKSTNFDFICTIDLWQSVAQN